MDALRRNRKFDCVRCRRARHSYSHHHRSRACVPTADACAGPTGHTTIARLRRRSLGERWCHLPRFRIRDELHLASLSLWLQRIECGAGHFLCLIIEALSIFSHRHFWILPIQRLIPLLSQYKFKRRVATSFPGAMGMIC